MSSLADLTLKLSRELSANHHECLQNLERLEAERTRALEALPGAARILRQWERAKADAAAARDETRREIDRDGEESERRAAERRAAELTDVESRLRRADSAALQARNVAEAKARADFEAALDKIAKTLGAPDEIPARAEARQAYDRALQAAHQAYLHALERSKNAQVDELRAALRREIDDGRRAGDRAASLHRAADQVYERALKAAETRARAALEEIAGTDAVQVEFDRRRVALKSECRRREEALFAEFRGATSEIT